MNLRLDTLAKMIAPGSCVADIGTDHAYLPIELVKTGRVKHAIASDIGQGPIHNAQEDIAAAGLNDQIETRLGPGLKTIKAQDHVDTVVIAGMGGKLITKILDEGWQKGQSYPILVLEPNIGAPRVRKWLMQHNYQIVAERLLVEAGHSYELIKAKLSQQQHQLTEKELYFGPLILKAKNAIFYQKWTAQLFYQQKLLNDLNKARHKNLLRINEVEQHIQMIKEEVRK